MKPLDCVLLIDDSEADNYLHKRVLARAGCAREVLVAGDGKQALDILRRASLGELPKPDLLFLDINMPVMDGFEFAREFQRMPDEERLGIVVMMLTTSINPADRQRAEMTGVIASYIPKPLTEEILLKVVEEHFPSRLVDR